MHQVLELQQLNDRLIHLEQQVNLMRQELTTLRQQTRFAPQSAELPTAIAYAWANKEVQISYTEALFTTLSIHNMPIGAQALQQKMEQVGLAPDELSRSIIEAREDR